jgi:hypothetical protein
MNSKLFTQNCTFKKEVAVLLKYKILIKKDKKIPTYCHLC